MTSHDSNMTNLGKQKIEVEEYCTLAYCSAVSEYSLLGLLWNCQPLKGPLINYQELPLTSDVSIQGNNTWNSYWLNFNLCMQVRNDCQLYA